MELNDKKFAVLVDADNISHRKIKDILDEIANYGTPTIKRIYGDFTNPKFAAWKEVLLENSITPIQQYAYTTGKNATDSALIIDAMDIGSVFNPRFSTSNLICRYVRAMQNSESSSQIETLYKLVGGKAEALEFRVSEGSKLCGVPLQELRLRENLLIGCIGRGGKIIIPSGQDTIEPGDSVIVVTCSAGLGKLEDILARGPGHE